MKKLLTTVCLCLGFASVHAEDVAITKPATGVLHAVGIGEIDFKYDIAHLNYIIVVDAENQVDAQNKLAEAQKAFDALLLAHKIGDDRVENGNAQLITVPKAAGIFKKNIENTYVAQIDRSVNFTNFDEIKPFVEAVAAQKIGASAWLVFDVQNEDELNEAMVASAIENAKTNAEADAQSAQVTLGAPIKVGDTGSNGGYGAYADMVLDKNLKLIPFDIPKGQSAAIINLSYAISSPEMTGDPQTDLTVSGFSETSVAPEYAVTAIALSETGKTVEDVQAALGMRVEGLKAALSASGLPAEDMKIIPAQINHVYADRSSKILSGYTDGFEASQRVEIEFKDMTQISAVLAKMVEAGFDSYEQVQFKIRDEKPVLNALRKAAFEKARKSAESRAKVLGMKLGAAIVVNTEGNESGSLGYEAAAAAPASDEYSKVKEIETKIEDLQFTDTVVISYELLPN